MNFERAALVLFLWALILVMANPFLENRALRFIAIACGIAASICFILAGG